MRSRDWQGIQGTALTFHPAALPTGGFFSLRNKFFLEAEKKPSESERHQRDSSLHKPCFLLWLFRLEQAVPLPRRWFVPVKGHTAVLALCTRFCSLPVARSSFEQSIPKRIQKLISLQQPNRKAARLLRDTLFLHYTRNNVSPYWQHPRKERKRIRL